MATTPPPTPGRALFPAVLPAPPPQYDQLYFQRLVDILTKVIEEITQPRQLVAGMLTLTDLAEGTPYTDLPGEVYVKDCPNCGVKVLAIETLDPVTYRKWSPQGRPR